jgi:hypothetical protein
VQGPRRRDGEAAMWRNNLQPDLSARYPCQATAPAPPPPRAGGSSPDPPSPLPKPRRHPRSRAPHRRGPGRTTSTPFHNHRSLTFPSTRAPRQTPSRRTPNPSYASLLEHQVIVFGTACAALQLTYSSTHTSSRRPELPTLHQGRGLGAGGPTRKPPPARFPSSWRHSPDWAGAEMGE